MVAFQEPEEFSKINQSVTTERTKDWKIWTLHAEETATQPINSKQNHLKLKLYTMKTKILASIYFY